MQVLMTEDKGAVVIKLVGKMMLEYEANDFHEAVLKAIEQNNKNIVVDLSEVEFMSSWGIGILMYGYTTCAYSFALLLICYKNSAKSTNY